MTRQINCFPLPSLLFLNVYLVVVVVAPHPSLTYFSSERQSGRMPLFGKTRTGKMQRCGPSHFVWEIPNVTTYPQGQVLDSAIETHNKVDFHFHLAFSASGDVGFYIHYKQVGIPKYSYFFENHKKERMRQQTAHTIPDNTERCGHWNVCSRQDLLQFLAGQPDVLRVEFFFDEDVIELSQGEGEDARVTHVLWTIPSLSTAYLNPFTSRCFEVAGIPLTGRVDARRASVSEGIATYDYGDVNALAVFLFARKGDLPAYRIRLLDASTRNQPHPTVFASVEPNAPGTAQMLIVDRKLIDRHVQRGTLCIQFSVLGKENPLNFLQPNHTAQSAAGPSRTGMSSQPAPNAAPAQSGGGTKYTAMQSS